MNNKEDIQNLLKDTVEFYPSILKRAIVKKFKDDGLVTSNKKKIKEGSHFPIFSANSEDVISSTLADELFEGYYENIEFEKCYKYSIPLFFECDNADFMSILSGLSKKNKAILFNEHEYQVINNQIKTNIIECIPTFKKTGKYVLIKFLIKQNTFRFINGAAVPYDIRYPIIISINPTKSVLEIRFDGGKFDADSQIEFITPLINYCIKWLKENLHLKLFSVNSDNAIERIKRDSIPKAIIYRQFMEMKSGASAELTASDNERNLLPFIGELRDLISNNEDVFNRCLESKKLLENYLDELEETANYPYIHIKWLDSKKSHEFSVKITFNYYNRKLIQMHSMQCAGRVMKERMEYAIEYLLESGAFTKGEEL